MYVSSLFQYIRVRLSLKSYILWIYLRCTKNIFLNEDIINHKKRNNNYMIVYKIKTNSQVLIGKLSDLPTVHYLVYFWNDWFSLQR